MGLKRLSLYLPGLPKEERKATLLLVRYPSGAKAHIYFEVISARLKSCPKKKRRVGVRGFPPLRQKKGARTGHGAVSSIAGLPRRWTTDTKQQRGDLGGCLPERAFYSIPGRATNRRA
jgi:hypothetical protein